MHISELSVPSRFASISPTFLASWAGDAVFRRGNKYFNAGKVHDIALVSGECVVATVDGTRPYSTAVVMKDGQTLTSVCTCPYGTCCKHAVALLLECAKIFAEKSYIPTARENDRRIYALDLVDAGQPDLSLDDLKKTLQSLNKSQLIDILIKAIKITPEIFLLCSRPGEPASEEKKIDLIVRKTRNAIYWEPERDDYHGRQLPDFWPVVKNLEALQLAGVPEKVLELSREILTVAAEQIDLWADGDECPAAIASCMSIACTALREIDWPMPQKLIWAADALLTDSYCLCDDIKRFLDENHPPEDWQPVADHFLGLLGSNDPTSSSHGSIVDFAVKALENSGRSAEILELRKRDALENGNYLPLIKMLVDNGSYNAAENYIYEGIKFYGEKNPFLHKRLRSCLLELRQKRQDWDAVLCMLVEDFVSMPLLDTFNECRETAAKLHCQPLLERLLRDFLVDRKLPWLRDEWPCRMKGACTRYLDKKTDYRTLITLAIEEKDPAEVLKWYDAGNRRERRVCYSPELIADAVRDFAPYRAIAMWRNVIEKKVGLTNIQAYRESSIYLRKMGACMRTHGMQAQWHSYLANLREKHRRKKRFIEILDELRLD